MVEKYQIPYHERDLGKLFCLNRAKDILNMLLSECEKARVEIQLRSEITTIERAEDSTYTVNTSQGSFQATSLVIASGGLSIPKMCASPLGYKVAEQFGHHIWPTTAGLVPFTLQPDDKEKFEKLSGIAVYSIVSNERIEFKENILFTHRGLSGPAILQISSYWQPGETININLLPDIDIEKLLKTRQSTQPKVTLTAVLATSPNGCNDGKSNPMAQKVTEPLK
jgi:predicted Rossmann fold flavoprotein